ncbi:MAG: hypothetical protein JWM11_3351 [Planctomycetaceae bacterium]|nr:hypothetical protein [Planctomycetaceae bacterium]
MTSDQLNEIVKELNGILNSQDMMFTLQQKQVKQVERLIDVVDDLTTKVETMCAAVAHLIERVAVIEDNDGDAWKRGGSEE